MSIEKEIKGSELPEKDSMSTPEKDGLNSWNDRLDENLETDEHSNTLADEKSKAFFEKNENITNA